MKILFVLAIVGIFVLQTECSVEHIVNDPINALGVQLYSMYEEGDCSPSASCAKTGGKCTGYVNENGKAIQCNLKDGNCCPRNEYCIDSKCVLSSMGQKCSKKGDCQYDKFGSLMYECRNHVCRPQFNQGDRCKVRDDCYGPMGCTDGICVGVAKNGTCTQPQSFDVNGNSIGDSCDFGLYCASDNTCKSNVEIGGKCKMSYECVMGSHCSPNGTCTKIFSLPKGSKCVKQLCSYGLVCSNGVCKEGNRFDRAIVCTDNKDCLNNETCSGCYSFTGRKYCQPKNVGTMTNCQKPEKSAYDCYQKFKCSSYYSYETGTCQHEYCLSAMESLWMCQKCSLYGNQYGSCYGRNDISAECVQPLPYWLTATILGGLLVVLGLFTFSIFKIGDACKGDDNKLKYQAIN
eukprot:TRINITY_DN10188_c0_g1_i1.p1 TRINITY_DN10188_c0_g1~~TRINITY_DN10188_c0_g1_i1.p1  ORF type:complete len:419 (-),score=65.92 TRINITY_DN10188_c0_g1_i1:28-1236(-)